MTKSVNLIHNNIFQEINYEYLMIIAMCRFGMIYRIFDSLKLSLIN